MKFESVEIYALETGIFKLDGGAMFGSVPKTMWEKAIPPDELNRIPMALRLILIKDSKQKRNLLVDAGIGDKWSEKMRGIYAIDDSKDSLEKSLKKHGLNPEDITDVVLTHLHFDHTGGSTRADSTGKFIPSFPHAKYYLQKDNFDWALKPNPRESSSYMAENFMPLLESKQLTLCNGVGEFEKAIRWPAVTVRLSYGHTMGLQCPLITLGDRKFFYPSDMIPTSAHVPIPWTMGYDLHIIKLMEEKEIILTEAVKDKWILVYEHDPVIAASEITKGVKHFERGLVVKL
jgi:glyoxylase-like metal-dependent hydrolase (beta-lactamase superfamily II)